MDSLIKRLQESESGSRELDGLIAYQFGWRFNGFSNGLLTPEEIDAQGAAHGYSFKEWPGVAGGWHKPGDRFRSFDDREDQDRWHEPPEWTTSLDAIVSLIGEKLPGWRVQLTVQTGAGLCRIMDREQMFDGYGKSGPLALCAALLAALQSQEPTP